MEKRLCAIAAVDNIGRPLFFRWNPFDKHYDKVSARDAVMFCSEEETKVLMESYKREISFEDTVDYITYDVKSNVTTWKYEYYNDQGNLVGVYPLH